MCGIAGFFSNQGRFSEDDLQNMTNLIAHRGPDAHGYFINDYVGLGHRRLSIIDLSDNAKQPMISANDQYIIVYNGEVYNFKELAEKYLDNDTRARLKSNSDTEIVLEGFAKMGPEFIRHMNGMFAFALYDRENKSMYLVRDRMGIKPLYYFADGINIAFSSELKSLLKVDSINKEIRPQSVKEYLHRGYIPAPFSIYKQIYKLNSGCYLKISEQGIEQKSYWTIREHISANTTKNENEALDHLQDLVSSAVKYRMYSDVPLGIFLSGGIDSGVIAATAARLSKQKIKTFSIGFDEPEHDESKYARKVADAIGSDHHEFIVTYKDAIALLPSLAEIFDEPFADSSAIPTMLVSKLSRKFVTVTLSGDGGDELFMGYGAHKWAGRLNTFPYKILRKPASLVFSKMSDRYKRVAALLEFEGETELPSHIFSQEQYLFSAKEIEQLCVNNAAKNNIDKFLPSQAIEQRSAVKRKLTAMESQALFDLENYLQDDLLVKVDRSSMLHSLECRVPLLDYRIVQYAINIDQDLKVRNKVSKYLLRKLLFRMLPESLFDRPKKGFSIPLEKWLNNELSYMIDDHLNEQVVSMAGLVKFEQVNKLVKRFRGGEGYLYNRVWQLIHLHQWFNSTKN